MAERLVNRAIRSETSFSEQFRRIRFSRYRFLAASFSRATERTPKEHRENTEPQPSNSNQRDLLSSIPTIFFFSSPDLGSPSILIFLHSLRLSEPPFSPLCLGTVHATLHRRSKPNEIIPAPIRLGWDFCPLCNTPEFFSLS